MSFMDVPLGISLIEPKSVFSLQKLPTLKFYHKICLICKMPLVCLLHILSSLINWSVLMFGYTICQVSSATITIPNTKLIVLANIRNKEPFKHTLLHYFAIVCDLKLLLTGRFYSSILERDFDDKSLCCFFSIVATPSRIRTTSEGTPVGEILLLKVRTIQIPLSWLINSKKR